jgi:rsbT co-antagonist protein RsbR
MSSPRDEIPEVERARALGDLLERRGDEVLQAWIRLQTQGDALGGASSDSREVTSRSEAILGALRDGVARSGRVDDPSGPEFEALRSLIADVSRRGARSGATPSETAHSVLALREALFSVQQTEHDDSSVGLAVSAMTSGRLVDALALLTFETFVRGREEVIGRQNQQLIELSTPVVELWPGIVAVPLIGTLDSSRAQVVMETLLQAIVEQHALVAILDITGVPTVDTLVAQHLLKTVTATRLMGAECIISGIRPQTAQTIVQLGIDLSDIITRATLSDALATAIARVPGGTDAAPGSGR